MSDNLSSIQSQMEVNEFVDSLKTLSASSSSSAHGDAIEQLHTQLKNVLANGSKDNEAVAVILVDNLHRIIPIFDGILSKYNEDDNNNDFLQTTSFLETITKAFADTCLFAVLIMDGDTSRLETIFQIYVGLLKETYFTDDNKYDGLINCIVPVVGCSGMLSPVTADQIPANLLSYLLTFTKHNWQRQHRESVIRTVLGLIKVLSKKPSFVPLVIESQWPHACVQWLTDINGENNSRPAYFIDYHICLIIQKLARHAIGVQVLNQLNCLQVLCDSRESMEKTHTELQFKCLHLLQCMIYVLLIEADEIKHMTMNDANHTGQALSELLIYTIEASRNEYLFYQCFHISDMLSVLCKIFVNDDILTISIDENKQLFDCLCQLTVHFANLSSDTTKVHQPTNDETLLTLINLLWSISFHQCYHERFQTNSLLMHTISNLATSSSSYIVTQTKSIPRDLCSLKKAAEGILWNLKSSSAAARPISNVSNDETKQRPLAMISYSHSDAVFCRELVERLSSHVPVWVDYKQAHDAVAHSDDLWEEIARAMEMATVIVLIVSKEYYDSKSCRQELSYASDTLKKRIIPVYTPNQQYRASGWLGIRIAGQKYIHFGRKLFTDAIKELASIVDTDQKPLVIASSPPLHPVPSTSVPTKITEEEIKLLTLKDWSSHDIRKWFDDNHIHKDLITLYADQFYTGTALIVYARHLKLFYRNEYIRIFTKYHKVFQGKKLDTLDFITFVDALYRLRAEYDPNYTVEDAHEKCHEPQSSRKVKSSDEGVTWL